MKKSRIKKGQMDQPVTLGVLFEFTEEVLLPRISDMMDDRFKESDAKMARMEHNLKVYIDDKLADYTSDIFKRLEKKEQRERQFKEAVIEIFKAHHIGSPDKIAFLEGLAKAS